MKQCNYEAPMVALIEVKVEKSFLSGANGTRQNYGDAIEQEW